MAAHLPSHPIGYPVEMPKSVVKSMEWIIESNGVHNASGKKLVPDLEKAAKHNLIRHKCSFCWTNI